MMFLRDILEMLAFRRRALRSLAGRQSWGVGLIVLSLGFLAFVLVRNVVYSELRNVHGRVLLGSSLLDSLLQLNLIQAVLYLSLVYVPAVICLSNALAGDGLGLTISKAEYRSHVGVLFPMWGILFLLVAPLQWFFPHFIVLGQGILGISIGLLVLLVLMTVYTVWAIKELSYISVIASLGVFALSWFTLPIFFILTAFFFALPLFLMIPVVYLVYRYFREHLLWGVSERDFQQHLHRLTVNPRDADAHYQLGLIHLKRGRLDAAQRYFENAARIQPDDPEYQYFLGRVFEIKEDWSRALTQYEETYRLNPQHGQGDIFREVGKGYLHTGRLEKATEFLNFFLQNRSSDPEGRYWLAAALRKAGKLDEMRVQLNTILEQARCNPRFFRRENREWIHRARSLLRQ